MSSSATNTIAAAAVEEDDVQRRMEQQHNKNQNNVELLPTPVKGKADWRDFRCVRLENGVTLCFVHDREAKTTAAAATVAAGAAADPREMSGLARTYRWNSVWNSSAHGCCFFQFQLLES